MVQLIGILLGFYVGMQAAVAFEVGREKNSTGLQIIASLICAVIGHDDIKDVYIPTDYTGQWVKAGQTKGRCRRCESP